MGYPFTFEVEPFELHAQFETDFGEAGEQHEGFDALEAWDGEFDLPVGGREACQHCQCGRHSKGRPAYLNEQEFSDEMGDFNTEFEDFDWEREANRNSPDYVRWVQTSLNRILGLKLAVDGKMGPATRSAIRNFQQKHGLVVDGILAPKTEAAIKAALSGIGVHQTTPPRRGGGISITGNRYEVFLIRETISGFPRYTNAVGYLPQPERAKIATIAKQIIESYGSGQRPIRTIQLVGHSDLDTPRRPDFEHRISADRALEVHSALSQAIERQSLRESSAPRPWPPFETRINWQLVAMGATQPRVADPRNESERLQNRRVEVILFPHRPSSVISTYSRVSVFNADGKHALTTNIENHINRFCACIGGREINRSNCYNAVSAAIGILGRGAGPNQRCEAMGRYGVGFVDSKGNESPLGGQVICCRWRSDNYRPMCTQPRYKGTCGHCSRANGRYLIVNYNDFLPRAVSKLKAVLDSGCVVRAGVLSGICDDKPDVACERKSDPHVVWKDCPEHWILILGHDGDTFVFWDSSGASAIRRCGHEFGLLHYDESANRLSAAADSSGMEVNWSGHHTTGFTLESPQLRYQVLMLRTGGRYGSCR